MNRLRRQMRHCCWLLAGLATAGMASSPSHESLQAVLGRAQSVVVAEILQVGETRREGYWQSLTLLARPLRTLHGPVLANALLQCRHEQGLPHQRGETRVWPLLSGSGMEFDLQRGQEVILLIAASEESGECRVLRVEPLQNEAEVSALAGQKKP